MALKEAIRTYHDLLTEEMAAETQGQLDDQMQQRGLYFGTRPLCTVLRPRFLTQTNICFCDAQSGRCCAPSRKFPSWRCAMPTFAPSLAWSIGKKS